MSDTEVAEKVKKTGASIVLVYIVAPLAILAIAWIFSTVTANRATGEAIEAGLVHLVKAMDKNTEAIESMDKDNKDGHSAIASMVYGVKLEVGTSNTRINILSSKLGRAVAHMDEHEKMIPKFEAWKSEVNLKISRCKDNLAKCEDKIEKLEHK